MASPKRRQKTARTEEPERQILAALSARLVALADCIFIGERHSWLVTV